MGASRAEAAAPARTLPPLTIVGWGSGREASASSRPEISAPNSPALSDEQRKMIYDTKASGRTSRIERFYDEASVDLVARREKFIIERFGYQRPHV